MGVRTTELPAPTHSVALPGCMAPSPSPSSSSPAAPWQRAGKRRGGAAAVVRRVQLVLSRDVGWCGQRAWRRLLRLLAQETKCICSSPTAAAAARPVTFVYDAASYAKNFDDGRGPASPYPAAAAVVANNAADNKPRSPLI
ncbi:hypothetical protein ACP4OV_024662 [Aristida adscensionis]